MSAIKKIVPNYEFLIKNWPGQLNHIENPTQFWNNANRGLEKSQRMHVHKQKLLFEKKNLNFEIQIKKGDGLRFFAILKQFIFENFSIKSS